MDLGFKKHIWKRHLCDNQRSLSRDYILNNIVSMLNFLGMIMVCLCKRMFLFLRDNIFFCKVILHLIGFSNVFKDLELTWTFGNGNLGFNRNHIDLTHLRLLSSSQLLTPCKIKLHFGSCVHSSISIYQGPAILSAKGKI